MAIELEQKDLMENHWKHNLLKEWPCKTMPLAEDGEQVCHGQVMVPKEEKRIYLQLVILELQQHLAGENQKHKESMKKYKNFLTVIKYKAKVKTHML